MQRVTVVAKLIAKPGMEERALEEFKILVRETHKEPGCINYDLHVSLDDPRTFIFYENWVSKQALDEHMATPHIVRLRSIASEFLAADPEILLYEMLSEPKPVPALH